MASKNRFRLPTTGEQVHVLIGGLHSPAECIRGAVLADGVEMVRLLEVGAGGVVFTPDFFNKGSLLIVRWTGQRHVTTFNRIVELVYLHP